MKKTILAIETSCDETGIALVDASGGFSNPKFKVIKNLVSSQIKIHRPFGGVVPGLAKREHIRNLPLLFKSIFRKSDFLNIDLIAVTVGPGLEPALWTGITFAQELAKKYKKPLIGANHLEGHLYSFLLSQKTASSKLKVRSSPPKVDPPRAEKLLFPAVVLSVSGGHTVLLLMKNLKAWKRLGETKDDAAGEAFDKVARMLNLPYPGGPEIEKLALRQAQGKHPKGTIDFPRPMLNQKNYDFSFSGLKTSVFYYSRDIEAKKREKNIREISQNVSRKLASKADIAASFQQAVIDVLVAKTMRAARDYGARSIILCGGVAANKSLRKMLKTKCYMSHLIFHVPLMEYNNDNAAMIAAAAYMGLSRKKKYKLEANGDLNI